LWWTNRNSNCDPNCYSNRDAYEDSDADTNSNSDHDSHQNAYRNTHKDSIAHTNTYANGDTHPVSYKFANGISNSFPVKLSDHGFQRR
jgi:Ni/Co efflux regulator RcnB